MIFGIEKMVLGVNFWNLISMSLVIVSAFGRKCWILYIICSGTFCCSCISIYAYAMFSCFPGWSELAVKLCGFC